jgi:hypothetical protein
MVGEARRERNGAIRLTGSLGKILLAFHWAFLRSLVVYLSEEQRSIAKKLSQILVNF